MKHRNPILLKTNEGQFLSKICYSDLKKIKPLENDAEPEIIIAAMKGNKELVKSIISKNLELVENTDKYKNTALTWAALYGHTEILNILIQNGADVNMADVNKSTALMGASINGHTHVVNMLTDKGKAYFLV